jgi:DNA mismatch repair protein MutS
MAQREWAKLEDLAEADLTPMLRQYLAAKAEAAGAILFFRMGDFYELFFEDAIEAAGLLDLALTSRDGADKKDRIPMAGVPVRALDGYLARLIRAGRTVCICDQVEDPKLAKGIVRREVVRTVTPGTVMEPELLEDRANNYLAALTFDLGAGGLALLDVTTGDFLAAPVESEQVLADELTRTRPAEVLVPDTLDAALFKRLRSRFTASAFRTRPDHDFDASHARTELERWFDLATLKGVGLDDAPAALACAGAALAYVQETQRGQTPHLRLPRRYNPSGYVVLDASTQRNLELVESLADKRRDGTLLAVLDRTQTHMGGRKLRQWILHPLLDVAEIRARLDAVEEFFNDAELRLRLRDTLRDILDLERLLGRITARTGNARDVKALGQSLEQMPRVLATIQGCRSELLASLRHGLDPLGDVAGWIAKAIVDEPPLALTEGRIIREGHDAELDRIRGLVTGGRDWIARLQREECEKTGIPKIKIGYNKIFGYYLEVTKSNTHLVPPHYERKQTLVNAERYITPELKQREEEIVSAQERMEKLEYELFAALRDRVAAEAERIHDTAACVAELDVLLSLADVAVTKNYCKPRVDDSGVIRIKDGRHPVVEDLMRAGDFVPNDLTLDPAAASMLIVTGPNMAGKSTYLRQAALITLMAQVGAFVPALDAQIGVVDRIFTRVGASDNLVRGESTFMVEMIETANILNAATPRSLLVLDEIGRGTSTFDGISIAWSVAEHIHNKIGAKTLFATHYHELTELTRQLEHAKNVNVAVREYDGKVVFLYRIVDGGADHSYGIQVAKLAGLPREVIARARDVLQNLESGNAGALGISEQMYLFGPAQPAEPSPVEKELEAVDPDALAPKEAHELLYHLKELLNRKKT